MARKVDEDKIKRIKEATMETIVNHGIEATTIAMIAKNAEVSGGYLYRIYSGKQELITSLYSEKVESLVNELESLLEQNPTTIEPIINTFIKNRIFYFQNETIASKFYYQLLHNENFNLNENLKKKHFSLMESIKKIGVTSGEVSETISLFQLHYHILIYPVDYINFKRNKAFGLEQSKNSDDLNYLTTNILKLLKM
ncbi:TetR/AcrR family transcriptional regulator [Aureibaculum marinum]|uniref:TetR/AcrR family transcriptional regulator n=1 Tax=Aureibaculum marinum TaxID=2487930 RepID=A0A3N4NJM6_9FLAO|nr:TetR/AcrR family transcriptional regulator [Aureibaculum marinum]RPD96524.1 TetR/AcrR family transcriptional regulator [Aureibaculum marinum]